MLASYQYNAFGGVAALSIEGDAWATLSVDQWANMTVPQWADLPVDLSPGGITGFGGTRQYYLDNETNLLLMGGGNNRGRYYDPTTGRFTSDDPIRQAGGDNLQQYGQNNPITNQDPSGHQSDDQDIREEQTNRAWQEQHREFLQSLKDEDPNDSRERSQHADAPQITPHIAVLNALSGGKILVDAQKAGLAGPEQQHDSTGDQLERSLQLTKDSFDRSGITKAMGTLDAGSKELAFVSGGLAFALVAPEAALFVGAFLLGAAITAAVTTRHRAGQSVAQISGGTIADVSGATRLYAGLKNKDIATQQPLGLNEWDQGQALGSGGVDFGASLFTVGSLAKPVWRSGLGLRGFAADPIAASTVQQLVRAPDLNIGDSLRNLPGELRIRLAVRQKADLALEALEEQPLSMQAKLSPHSDAYANILLERQLEKPCANHSSWKPDAQSQDSARRYVIAEDALTLFSRPKFGNWMSVNGWGHLVCSIQFIHSKFEKAACTTWQNVSNSM